MSLLTVTEVADFLRCSRGSARRLLASGAIPAAKVAGAWKADERAVSDYFLRATSEQAAPAMARRRRRRSA